MPERTRWSLDSAPGLQASLHVAANCEIGAQSIALYCAEMLDGSRLGALSLLMRSEVLPPGRVWSGSPLDSSPEQARAHTMVA